MADPYFSMSRVRLASALLLLALIYAFGWYKSSENHRDRQALASWREQLDELDAESRAERARLGTWVHSLYSRRDAKRRVEIELNGDSPLNIADGARYRWRHPEYGIPVELAFNGNWLVYTSVGGPQLTQVQPEPPTTYRKGPAETIRHSIKDVVPWIWIVAFIFATISHRYGQIAAITALGLSLSYACAVMVSPYYTLTMSGILSNDPLFIVFLLYLCSTIIVAVRTPRDISRPKFRFGLRTVLVTMAIVAISMAVGSFGYATMMISLPGLLVYLVVVYSFKGSTSPRSSQTTAT